MSQRSVRCNADLWLMGGDPAQLFSCLREQRPWYLSLSAGDGVNLDLRASSLEMVFTVGPERGIQWVCGEAASPACWTAPWRRASSCAGGRIAAIATSTSRPVIRGKDAEL